MGKFVPHSTVANMNWRVYQDDHGRYGNEQVTQALLMDIRDELKIANRKLSALECSRFIQIPTTLEAIKKNTAKPKRKKAKRVIR